MLNKLIWNDVRQNKLLSAATIFFMAVSAMMLGLTALLFSGLLGSVNALMEQAQVPDFLQMHTGELEESEISQFAGERQEIAQWQICRFLNLDNSEVTLGGHSLLDSTQDNGLCVQSERFDYLLDMDNNRPDVLPGQVYVPVCYRARYELSIGDTMQIGSEGLTVAGFLRDAQMNSMMASSKRFLVSQWDYERLKPWGEEEYLIEFLLKDGGDTNAVSTAYTGQGLPSNGPAITKPLIRMMNALSDGTTILVIFLAAIVVLLVALLCIRFILSIRMERDKREVGMLKALGIGKGEIKRLYFSKYILFSVCGGLLGLVVSAILQGPLEWQIRELYGASNRGAQAAVFALCAVAVVETVILLSVWHSLKKTDRLSALAALFPVREQKQNWRQYLLIGFVAAACSFLMLLPENLYSTLSSPTFVTYMGIGDADIRMDIRQGVDISLATAQITANLKRDEQVERYAVLQTQSLTAVLSDGTTCNLTVETGNHTVFPVRYSEGTPPILDKEIALSSLNAKELGLSVGDTLPLRINGTETLYSVCGIYSDITNGGKTAKISSRTDNTPVIWSVLYVSLKDPDASTRWMEAYSQMGADVTDIEDYVRDTYGPTLAQLRLASRGAMLIAVLVAFVVITLFLRLIVERNRDAISLQKALGFTSGDIGRVYCLRGFLTAAAGVISGLALGTLLGESLCGIVLKSFGADGFCFIIRWDRLLVGIPAIILGTTMLAVLMGTAEVRRVKAYECCTGRE
jgi:putative ABC transport system permease protein